MKNVFILAINDHHINFFWPGKLDTINPDVFTNTASKTSFTPIKANHNTENNKPTLIKNNYTFLYIIICLILLIVVIRMILAKKTQ